MVKIIFVFAAIMTISTYASATLVGDQITATNSVDTGTGVIVFEGPTTVTADDTGSPELTNFGGLWDIDFEDSAIHLTCSPSSDFCGLNLGEAIGFTDIYLFEGLDWDGSGFLQDASLSGQNNLGASVSLVSPTSVQLSYIVPDIVPIGEQIWIELTPIPVPAAAYLFIPAVAALGFARRKTH